MKLKPSPFVIPEDEPFKNDVLERKPMIEALTSLVSDVNPPFVICVDSPWGTGKTTFLELWQAYIKKMGRQNLSTLYFNAWETDFASDPLVAFVGELTSLAKSKISGGKGAKQINKIKEIGAKIARRAIPAAIKAATAGVLSVDDFTEEVAADLAADLAGDAIEQYEKSKSLIDQFRVALKELVNKLPRDEGSGESRLLILVDELDRCRPSYALNLLESIKHLFSAENVVFVLALDKRQLCASVEATYGGRIDSDDYLRRFIDLEFSLRITVSNEAFVDYLFGQFDFQQVFEKRKGSVTQYDASALRSAFVELSSLFGLSLRAQAQCFSRFRVALLSTPPNMLIYPELLVLLVIIRAAARDVYERYISKDGNATEVLNCIESRNGGLAFLQSRSGEGIEAVVISAKRDDYGDVEPPEFVRYMKLVNAGVPAGVEPSKEQMRARSILERIQHYSRFNAKPNLEYVVGKVELLKNSR